jgi:hypothetical protein
MIVRSVTGTAHGHGKLCVGDAPLMQKCAELAVLVEYPPCCTLNFG